MSDNINKKRDAFIIAEEYGFFPAAGTKFEMTYEPETDNAWAFFANANHRYRIHVSFESDDLVPP